jgi:glycosyltransferase involved in cell wall biosynthesis
MHILFIADGRSPTAINWISYFLTGKHEVHLVSTFACQADERLASFHVVPVAFSGMKRSPGGSLGAPTPGRRGVWGASVVKARTLVRQWLGPLTLPRAARQLRQIVEQVQPELVHAMRIPYEGMLAALANLTAPLLVSVWGNDFTLHARSTPWMGWLTRQTLLQADALHADCQRDVHLAHTWGFGVDKPAIVLPGAGGIRLDLFYPAESGLNGFAKPIELDEGEIIPVVINPRGIRTYVRNDIFFQAVPLVLARRPGVRFLCPNMAGEAQAMRWVAETGCASQVELLPHQTRAEMAALFRKSAVVVSPSTHDGTPNTLLEAMACGCFPVVGDIESLREWITPGVNGMLVDPADANALARAILTALEQQGLRQRAGEYNRRLVAERAEYYHSMSRGESFYASLIGH